MKDFPVLHLSWGTACHFPFTSFAILHHDPLFIHKVFWVFFDSEYSSILAGLFSFITRIVFTSSLFGSAPTTHSSTFLVLLSSNVRLPFASKRQVPAYSTYFPSRSLSGVAPKACSPAKNITTVRAISKRIVRAFMIALLCCEASPLSPLRISWSMSDHQTTFHRAG